MIEGKPITTEYSKPLHNTSNSLGVVYILVKIHYRLGTHLKSEDVPTNFFLGPRGLYSVRRVVLPTLLQPRSRRKKGPFEKEIFVDTVPFTNV